MSKSNYEKVDYHYLFVEAEDNVLMVKCNGQLALPCIESYDTEYNKYKILTTFHVNLSNYSLKWTPIQTIILKYRKCGIRRILHVVKMDNKMHVSSYSNNEVGKNMFAAACVWVPVEELVVNKPNLLSEYTKVAVMEVGKWRGWKKKYKGSKAKYSV